MHDIAHNIHAMLSIDDTLSPFHPTLNAHCNVYRLIKPTWMTKGIPPAPAHSLRYRLTKLRPSAVYAAIDLNRRRQNRWKAARTSTSESRDTATQRRRQTEFWKGGVAGRCWTDGYTKNTVHKLVLVLCCLVWGKVELEPSLQKN